MVILVSGVVRSLRPWPVQCTKALAPLDRDGQDPTTPSGRQYLTQPTRYPV